MSCVSDTAASEYYWTLTSAGVYVANAEVLSGSVSSASLQIEHLKTWTVLLCSKLTSSYKNYVRVGGVQ